MCIRDSVQTADETILERGTAYLTDAGMCGPAVGVLGREREPILQRFPLQTLYQAAAGSGRLGNTH